MEMITLLTVVWCRDLSPRQYTCLHSAFEGRPERRGAASKVSVPCRLKMPAATTNVVFPGERLNSHRCCPTSVRPHDPAEMLNRCIRPDRTVK